MDKIEKKNDKVMELEPPAYVTHSLVRWQLFWMIRGKHKHTLSLSEIQTNTNIKMYFNMYIIYIIIITVFTTFKHWYR